MIKIKNKIRSNIICITLFILSSYFIPYIFFVDPSVSAIEQNNNSIVTEKKNFSFFDLNNVSLDVDKAIYGTGKTVDINLTVPPEIIKNFTILGPKRFSYAILPSNKGEYEFMPDSPGKYIINVSLDNGSQEKFLTAEFEVVDFNLVIEFGEPEHERIVPGGSVNWSQGIFAANPMNFSISDFPIEISLPLDYSNLVSDPGFTINNTSVLIDLAPGKNMNFTVSYRTSPVMMNVSVEQINILDLIPEEAFDITLYREIEAGVPQLTMNSNVSVKRLLVWHNSTFPYHNIPINISVNEGEKVFEIIDGSIHEISASIQDGTASFMIPELYNRAFFFIMALEKTQGKAKKNEPVEWQLSISGMVLKYKMIGIAGSNALIPANLETLKIKEVEKDVFAFKSISDDIIVIGEENDSSPQPYLKLDKWGGEVTLKIAIPQGKKGKKTLDKNKLNWSTNEFEVNFYPREPETFVEEIEGRNFTLTTNDMGGVEFDLVLKKKPQTNIFEFPIETQGLDFYYQPPLHPQHPTWSDENGDSEPDTFQPENAVGSYAVYHKTKKDHILGGTDYKTGKAFHIYRPKVIDAVGNEIWGILDMDEMNKTLTVTIDKAWLESAIYPVTIDPTFGYTTGGVSYTCGAGVIQGSNFTGASGTVDMISIWAYDDNAAHPKFKPAIYLHSDSSFVAQGAEITGTLGTYHWYNHTVSGSPSISAVEYVLVGWGSGSFACGPNYDAGVTNQGHTQTLAYGTWPDPATFTHNNNKYSIYVTYTAGGGAITYNLSGYVTNASSGPGLSGATVQTNTSLNTTTNASGFYNFTGLSNGTYIINASFAGYGNNSTTKTVNGAHITNANISLWPSISIDYVSPTDANNSVISRNWSYVNVSVDNASTSFIDWNRSLVGWWRFNRETGENDTFVRDWSSYGKNGTMNNMNPGINNCTGNCSGWTTSGKFGNGMRFDGVNDYITTNSYVISSTTNSTTYEFWSKSTYSSAYQTFISRSEDVSQGTVWISRPGDSNSLQWEYSNGTISYKNVFGTDLFSGLDNTWFHTAITADYTNKQVKIYRNGVLFYGETITGNMIYPGGNKQTFIGKYDSSIHKLNGSIDEVRIWNRILSPEEINASYNTGLYRLYHNFTNLSQGNYTYTAYAQDLAGNVNQTETRSLTIDYNAYRGIILVATNRYVILDDPNTGTAGPGGFTTGPGFAWTSWTGKNTQINATALYIDNSGTPISNEIISFTLYWPNGTALTTIDNTTNSLGLANFSYDLNGKNYYGKWNISASTLTINDSANFIYNWWGCDYSDAKCSAMSNIMTPPAGTATANSPYLSRRDNTVNSWSSHYAGTTNCTYCHQSYDGLADGSTLSSNHTNKTSDVHRNITCDNVNCHGNLTTHRTNELIYSCFNTGCHGNVSAWARNDLSNKSTLNSSTVASALSLYSINGTAFNATFHTPNSSLPCIICHGPMHNITNPNESQRFMRNNNTEDSQCITCHSTYTEHNLSNMTSGGVNCTLCHSDDVHTIKVFAQNATYVNLNKGNPNTYRGNCTNCHQNASFFPALQAQPMAGRYTGRNPPQVTLPLEHSNDPSAGTKWNQTPGYWSNSNQLFWCQYCHGNTTHNTTALGRPSQFDGNNTVNSTISTSSSWCASCHWQGYTNGSNTYNNMVSTFTREVLPVPPEITGNATYGANQSNPDYFNHTSVNKDDSTCKSCHGSLSSGITYITGFMHNVALDISPQYSLNQTNSTVAGQNVLFSLYWTDNNALAGYIFSFDNGTGIFSNNSYAAMTGTGNWSNVTKTVNSTVGSTIRWRVYANDTSGNMNASSIFSFTTTQTPSLTVCTNITAPGSYTLVLNITNSSASKCINISSSNVTFDGAGFGIDGVDTGSTYGVYVYNATVALTNVTVKNVTVADWDYGIYYKTTSNGNVTNNNASSNNYGIYMDSASNNNTLTGNNASSNVQDGIHVQSAHFCSLTSNIVISNVQSGINLWGSNNCVLTNNTVRSNTNYGIYLYSVNSSVINNNASSNFWGMYLISATGNALNNNTLTSNTYGIYLSTATGNTLNNNTLTSNTNSGIYLVSSSSNNNITNSSARSNNYGINIQTGCTNNSLSQNNITSNTGYGFALYGNSNTLNNNTANSNAQGFVLSGSSNNILFSNTVNSNTNYGIYLMSSSNNNNLSNNNASLNTQDGFYISQSHNSTLTGNNATLNKQKGITLAQANNSILLNNNASSNTNQGIYTQTIYNTTLSNNTAYNNSYGIHLDSGSNNTILRNNTVSQNRNYGIYVTSSRNNTIYNNNFNNTNNSFFSGTVYNNTWNTTKTNGTNIIGGAYLGGNYWAYPNGTGFSQTCTNADGDGICDSSYTLASSNVDYLPLTLVITPPDSTPPQYSLNQTNSTGAGQNVLFSLYWTDNNALAGYIFSFDDGTGTFSNDSYAAMTGTGNWSNVTKTVNSTVGSTIRWRVYANDTSGNMNASEVFSFITANTKPDFQITNITFIYIGDTSDVSETGTGDLVRENANVTVNATVHNYGGDYTGNSVYVGFYDGNSGQVGRQFANITLRNATGGTHILQNTDSYSVGYWNPSLAGTHNISVWADWTNVTWENSAANETNNNNSKFVNVTAWQKYWGNVSGNVALASSSGNRMYQWAWSNATDTGYIFFVNSGIPVNWTSLHGVGNDRDNNLNTSGNDFYEADTALNLKPGSNNATGFINNNITQLFCSGGSNNATNTTYFIVRGTNITNVPIVNSTNMTDHRNVVNANFITGLFWDQDSGNGIDYYDGSQNLVFAGKVRPHTTGLPGVTEVHNYEVAIPSALNTTIGGNIEFYVELK